MPAVTSTSFANNKNGSGKTFLLFQAACDAAHARPERNVLVIDLSLYSDTTALLMGGARREQGTRLGARVGIQQTMDNIAENKRADCLLRDLDAYCRPAEAQGRTSLFGTISAALRGAGGGKKRPRLSNYYFRPHIVNRRVPSNLYLIAGAGKSSWDGAERGGIGEEWEACASALHEAFDDLEGDWHVFVDTDHLAASPLTKIALGATKDVVISLSLDEGDFQRMFEDATSNALFADVMIPMAKEGSLRAKVQTLVFSQVAANKNGEFAEDGMQLPFTPARLAIDQMRCLAASLLQAVQLNPEELEPTFAAGGDVHISDMTLTDFCQRYCTACKTFPVVACNLSKLNGAPLCTMDHTDATLHIRSGEMCTAETRPKAETLQAIKDEISFIRRKILTGSA